MFPPETGGSLPPQPVDLHLLSLSDSLGKAKNNAQMVVVITCVEIIIYHPAAPVPLPPSVSLFPLPQSLFLSPPPLKTAAQPVASKAGFTQQSSSRENGCCFQVLFAHLSGGDCSGENGISGCAVFPASVWSVQNRHVSEMAPLSLQSNVFGKHLISAKEGGTFTASSLFFKSVHFFF